MEKECECYEEEAQPYRKMDYKPIIYMVHVCFDVLWSDSVWVCWNVFCVEGDVKYSVYSLGLVKYIVFV